MKPFSFSVCATRALVASSGQSQYRTRLSVTGSVLHFSSTSSGGMWMAPGSAKGRWEKASSVRTSRMVTGAGAAPPAGPAAAGSGPPPAWTERIRLSSSSPLRAR